MRVLTTPSEIVLPSKPGTGTGDPAFGPATTVVAVRRSPAEVAGSADVVDAEVARATRLGRVVGAAGVGTAGALAADVGTAGALVADTVAAAVAGTVATGVIGAARVVAGVVAGAGVAGELVGAALVTAAMTAQADDAPMVTHCRVVPSAAATRVPRSARPHRSPGLGATGGGTGVTAGTVAGVVITDGEVTTALVVGGRTTVLVAADTTGPMVATTGLVLAASGSTGTVGETAKVASVVAPTGEGSAAGSAEAGSRAKVGGGLFSAMASPSGSIEVGVVSGGASGSPRLEGGPQALIASVNPMNKAEVHRRIVQS